MSTIPDQSMQEEIRSIHLRSPGFPLVSKVTLTSYVTRQEITPGNPSAFYNIKVNAKAGSKDIPECKSLSC